MIQTFTDPRSIPALAPLLWAHAPGLIWSLGLIARWGALGRDIPKGWRFYVMWEGPTGGTKAKGKQPRALLMGDPGGNGWWGLVAPSKGAGRQLIDQAPEFPMARALTGSPDLLQALIPLTQGMEGPWHIKASIAMGRERCPGDGDLGMPPGVSLATPRDVESLMIFDPGHPGHGLRHVKEVLRARSIRGEVFVIRKDGLILGMGEAIFAGPYRDVQRVTILPAFRGKGLGRQLMEGILWDAHQTGHDLSLCVEADNLVARRLYGSLGFRRLWERSDWTREP